MDSGALITALTSLLVAGLAGSLHCVGMCGPILIGFAGRFEQATLTIHGKPVATAAAAVKPSLTWDFACYHVGRIWTYAMLGLAAGWLGHGVRTGSATFGWQRPTAIVMSIVVILTGIILLDLIPRWRIEALFDACGMQRLRNMSWFTQLVGSRSTVSRLLLGAVMGLLPCGLVYAMLVVVVALPHPFYSALGMVAFGVGTLPALSAVLVGRRMLPATWRIHGTRIAAVTIIALGAYMLIRTLAFTPPDAVCPFCH